MTDPSVDSDKKTFLKAQLPKLEAEIKQKKEFVLGLLEEEELDPRGEWFVLAQKITKQIGYVANSTASIKNVEISGGKCEMILSFVVCDMV